MLIGAVLLTLLLATLYLTASGQGTATTYRIVALEAQATQLQQQNEELELQVGQEQSLDRVQAEATKLGMVAIDSQHVLYVDVPPASAQRRGGTPVSATK